MDGYLNEAEVQIDIENAIKHIVSDYKIFVYARAKKPNSRSKKTVTFMLILSMEKNNEDVFDALVRTGNKNGGKLNVVSSIAQLNETKRIIEDVFKIEAEVKINC